VLIDANPNAGQARFYSARSFQSTDLSQRATARGPRDVAYNINQYAVQLSAAHQQHELCGRTLAADQEHRQLFARSRVVWLRLRCYHRSDCRPEQPFRTDGRRNLLHEELQLQGRVFNDSLQYVVGGFIDRQWPTETSRAQFDYFPISVLLGAPLQYEQRLGTRSRAGFTQLTYDLGKLMPALQGVSVTGGYRYTHDEAFIVVAHWRATVCQRCGQMDYGSYTFSLDYQVRPRTLLYVSARDAFKAGG